MNKVSLAEKFGMFSEHWSPKVVGRGQDCDVKLAKLLGEFEWHHHPEEDEMFLVVKGRLVIKFRDKDVLLNEAALLTSHFLLLTLVGTYPPGDGTGRGAHYLLGTGRQ